MLTDKVAFDRLTAHTTECLNCRPGSGVLCDEGTRLHQAWKAAEAALPPLPKVNVAEEMRRIARRRERRLDREGK